MSSKKPVLGYWDMRALGEPIRLLLNYLEIDFEDHRIPFGNTGASGATFIEYWENEKSSLGLDFPNVPYYIDEDVKLTQSLAIMEYIGGKYNLCGETLQESAVINMVAQTVNDLRWQALVVYNAEEFHEVKEDWKKGIPERVGGVSKFLEGKEYVLGGKITWVDFLLYESMEWYRQFAPEVFEEAEELKNLNEFRKRIEALEQIKAYMESERFKDWPFFAACNHFGHSKDPDYKPPVKWPYRNFAARYPLDKP